LEEEAWVLAYCKGDYEIANELVKGLKNASNRYSVRVAEPQYIEIPVNRARNPTEYIECLENDVSPKYTQIVIVLLQDQHHKAPIKKRLDEIGIPS